MARNNIHPVHTTDTYLTPIPEDYIKENLAAAEVLLQPSLTQACAKSIKNCTLSLRRTDTGVVFPSLFFRTDMPKSDPLELFRNLHNQNHYGMRTEGLHLDWGCGHTFSPEILMAYIGSKRKIRKLFFQKQAAFTLGLDPGIKGSDLGDVIVTKHPYLQNVIDQLGAYNRAYGFVGNEDNLRKYAVGILQAPDFDLYRQIPNLKLASFTAIAPTPGRLSPSLEAAMQHLGRGSKVNIALSGIRASSHGIINDRQQDEETIAYYLNKHRGQHLRIETNQLAALQRGEIGSYEAASVRDLLSKFGPFDTKYTSSGATQDFQNPSIDLYTFII